MFHKGIIALSDIAFFTLPHIQKLYNLSLRTVLGLQLLYVYCVMIVNTLFYYMPPRLQVSRGELLTLSFYPNILNE